MVLSQLWAKVHRRYQNTVARVFHRRPIAFRLETPLISFTFDDFPRSALLTGGSILKSVGARGTYYASLGLMGTQGPTGAIFLREDLQVLLDQGHELGCHTFDHCHSWKTDPQEFGASIAKNQRALSELCPGAEFRTFSYPISDPRPASKRIAGRRFACCRGGGQAFEASVADLNYLQAYFLDKDRCDLQAVKKVIEENCRAGGWLMFATHDVCEGPTRFGCTPAFFEEAVRYSVRSGARIVPVVQAWDTLRAQRSARTPLGA